MPLSVEGPDFERPPSVPTRGLVRAYDAGWDAHRLGLARDTVAALAPPSGRDWALLGWDTRALIAQRQQSAA